MHRIAHPSYGNGTPILYVAPPLHNLERLIMAKTVKKTERTKEDWEILNDALSMYHKKHGLEELEEQLQSYLDTAKAEDEDDDENEEDDDENEVADDDE
jgi:hypothetical protein